MSWLKLTFGISFPPTWLICSPCCHRLTCICETRCKWPFTPLSRASGLGKDDVGNAWLKHLGIIGKSMALACWTGVMVGLMAALPQGALLMFSVNKYVALWLVLNNEDALPS